MDDFPPLEGENVKRRPVVVVSTPEELRKASKPIVIMAISTSTLDPDRIPLPNTQDNPNTKSGLPHRCWAVPRWYLAIRSERLIDTAGYITGQKLREIVAAYERELFKPPED